MFSISSQIFNVFGNIEQMFCCSDGPEMFCQIKFTLYELSRVEAAGSQCGVDWGPGRPVSLKRRAADAFTVSGRSGLSVGCSSSCPKSGSHAGRTGPMEWGDTGLGQDWTGLGSQYNSKYI